ncbi:hypothetical protein JCM19241_5965 [Vibrio ishigakensis]|uniref:Uncharacterized protein n=1 Tax=Vibrio ishigakensis TaxID=1481914 RepID=A0A0B8QS48_9VIBR|nr:hypothetical protein JCM19241_5965 [Vibrio ishigakensis]
MIQELEGGNIAADTITANNIHGKTITGGEISSETTITAGNGEAPDTWNYTSVNGLVRVNQNGSLHVHFNAAGDAWMMVSTRLHL